MLALLVLSTLAAAVIFVTQTETWNSANYKFLTQARYAAEAGAQNTQNWIINNYVPPTTAQLAASYDTTKSPVVCIAGCSSVGSPVVLSALTSGNYPDSSQQSAFSSALGSQSVPGLGNVSYSTTATLIGVTTLGGMTWKITSQGNVAGPRPAQVQVVETIASAPPQTFGIVGLGTSCPSVTFTGGTMDTWSSAGGGTYAATHQNSGANIGTNGNVTLSGGSTRINGTISDSRNDTVGGCPDGITNNVGGTPWAGLAVVPTITYPPASAPSPMTVNSNINANSNTCWGASPAGCTVIAGPAVQIVPGSYGNLTSNSDLHLSTGTYNFNSVNLNGGSLTLDSVPVIINLGGNGISSGGTLFASQSSTTINDGGIPSNLTIESAAGAGMSNPPVITMNASSSMYAVVYATNAYVHITGSSHFLGSVIANKVTCDSSGGFSYDTALNGAGIPVYNVLSFTWSKF